MYAYNGIGRKIYVNEHPIEPHEPNAACICSICGNDVYFGDFTYDGYCSECFQEFLEQRIKKNLPELAEELGFNVIKH